MNSVITGSKHGTCRSRGSTPPRPRGWPEDQLKAACEVEPGQDSLRLDDGHASRGGSDVCSAFFPECVEGLASESPSARSAASWRSTSRRIASASSGRSLPGGFGAPEAFQRDFDRRAERPAVHGCEVRDDPAPGREGRAGTGIAGEEMTAPAVGDDRARRVDAVESRERALHEDEIGLEPLRRRDRSFPSLAVKHAVARCSSCPSAEPRRSPWLDDEYPELFGPRRSKTLRQVDARG